MDLTVHLLSFVSPPIGSRFWFALCVDSSLFDLPYDCLDVLSVHQLCISMLTSFNLTSLTQETPPMQLVSSEQKRHSTSCLDYVIGLLTTLCIILIHEKFWTGYSFSLYLQMFLSIETWTKLWFPCIPSSLWMWNLSEAFFVWHFLLQSMRQRTSFSMCRWLLWQVWTSHNSNRKCSMNFYENELIITCGQPYSKCKTKWKLT